MHTLHIYLNFDGQCEEAFSFYKSVFGGEYADINRMGDMPLMEGMPPMSEEQKQKIMHVAYPIKNINLFGSDIPEGQGFELQVGNNMSISINAESKDEADRIFNGLSSGGKVTMPIADTFWNAYFGMFTDKFGINWMVNFDHPAS